MRQKRPRFNAKFCAGLKKLTLLSGVIIANRVDAQNSVPVRDSLAIPTRQTEVSADAGGFLQSPLRRLRLEADSGSMRALREPDGGFRFLGAARRSGSVVLDTAALAQLAAARRLLGQQETELPFRLNVRLEGKMEKFRNDRCAVVQYRAAGSNCVSRWTPGFDFQADLLSRGTVGERVHIDLDFNTQREYEASNNISIRYEGKPGRVIEGIELGNISFAPPQSRFITSGIPSGNYGVLARGRVGALTYTGVFAQQKGNVVKDRPFVVGGGRAVQLQSAALEDVAMEVRRFFITVDPRQFAGYPNIDILNRAQMQRLAASLPDSVRPVRLYVYKQLIGAINPNPRGPQLSVRGARNSARQIYEVLRENVDYYVDPSQLWIALAAPLAQNERLAVAYEVSINGVIGRSTSGGTPDVEFTTAPQFANLLWEPELQPTDTSGYFQREVKSVYRLGGSEIRRESITMKIVTGTSGDQERTRDPSRGSTYLQLFGMSQPTNPDALDIENRVWPRPQDPNRLATAPTQNLLSDNFLVFPSLQPFARAGLAQPFANPANDTLYTFPNEYFYSNQRPQSIFRFQTTYITQGPSTVERLDVGSVQIRPLSERVLLDGQPLIREVDYTMDYENGVINFNRSDTLFLQQRSVVVRFEENQAFITAPTSIFGWTSTLTLEKGQLGFTAISQQQRTQYNRPPLGLESAGSLVAGITANFGWEATALSSVVRKLPFATPDAVSRIRMIGELAISKPQPNAAGQAYLATFEDNVGREFQLSESAWALSSQPAAGTKLPTLLGGTQLTLSRNATVAFQNAGFDASGKTVEFTLEQIDPRVQLRGTTILGREPVLWLTQLPLRVGGLLKTPSGGGKARNAWTIGNSTSLGVTPVGQRWSSLVTVLNPSGDDLSRIENIEFFTFVRVDGDRVKNPILVLDFGDISENRVAFAPETLTVNAPARQGLAPDTTFQGKRLVGFDRLDSERDRFSRAFNAIDNDIGIAGSVADSIIVADKTGGAAPFLATKVPICSADIQQFKALGDSRANCTVRNNRLDEEDIDLDGQLNLTSADGNREQWKRFVVDLSKESNWTRIGGCRSVVTDSNSTVGLVTDSLCWVQVRLNWRTPTDSLNAPNDRRMRAMRLTVISAAGESDDAFTRIALSRFQLVGAPWVRRSDRPLSGIAGDSASAFAGYVISSRIGTQDSTATVVYQPPPGVLEESEERLFNYSTTRQQVNEHSLRLQAGVPGGQFPVFARAESYFRFNQGNTTFMNYRTLRVWMRGNGHGWGANGELNAFIKIGRDENNFYLYRTPVNAGLTAAAWEPEIRVSLERFQSLRAQLESNALRNSADSLSCSGADLELIKRSGLPRGITVRRFAICQNGYIVYSADPGITPPNLAGVQELAVGFVRMDSVARGGSPIFANDTLELWVDDVRLSDVVADVGFAGEIGLFGNAGDLADFRLNFTRRDPNFRQLGEAPTFLTTAGVAAGTTVHLDRLFPRTWGIAMPLSINYGRTNVQQMFINQTDVRADGIRGLRDPRDTRIDYALALRRATPLAAGWYAPLLNGLMLSGVWGHGNGQSTYQKARNNNYAVTASLTLDGETTDRDSVDLHLPGVIDRILGALPKFMRESESIRGLRTQRLRWKPARFQVLSGVTRYANATTSYLAPISIATDTGVAARVESHLWQNTSTLEFRPINALIASLDARQSLDLRNYDSLPGIADSLNRSRAAAAERVSMFGVGMGLERERSFGTTLAFRPGITPWFEPGVQFRSSFSLYKDPNARALIRDSSAANGFRLPKRLGALQSVESSINFDAGGLLTSHSADSTRWKRLGKSILPFRIDWSRTLTSNYDNTALNPSLGYQFGLGGVQSFRGTNSVLATGAGRFSNFSAGGALQLPYSITLRGSYQQGTTALWTRRVIDNFQALITSRTRTYPSAEATWRLTLAKPNKVLSALTATIGYVIGENNTDVVSESGAVVEQGRSRTETQPMSAQINWSFFDGVRTTAAVRRSVRFDRRPGSVTRNNNPLAQTYTIDKDFTLPESWKARSKLKTSVQYDFSGALSVVEDAPSLNRLFIGTGIPSVLTNSGRRQFNFRADTDLSEVASFSFTGSHTVIFDRNYNRQTSMTIFSTVLQLHFGAGEVRGR